MCTEADIKISVIMPIYNACDYLRPAMDSVLSQTIREIEVICIDDGSTDSSYEIIKEYQKADERVRIVTETNAGPALARNNGIKRARGEYLAFLDADDFYEPTFLEALYSAARSKELDIAIASYDIYNSAKARFEEAARADHIEIYSDGKVTSKSENPDLILSSTTGSAWNKIFRREFVLQKGLVFLPDVRMYEDVYFTVTALSLAERVSMDKRILVHHRVHNEQARAKGFSKYYSQIPVVYFKIKEFLMQNGMYAPLSDSYLNLSAGRCYKIFNILSKDSKERFWDLLHSEYAEKLGWKSCVADDFENEDVCKFALNVCVYTYKQYKKRLAKGIEVPRPTLPQQVKETVKKVKRVSFFSRIFGKKESSE